MTEKQLKQYRSLKREVEELSEQLNQHRTHDVVKTSSLNFPYTQGVAHIEGLPFTIEVKRLQARMRKCVAEIQLIRDFVDSIQDSELRRIFEHRYIDGPIPVSWRAVAHRVGVSGDGSTERKKVIRYLYVSSNSLNNEI